MTRPALVDVNVLLPLLLPQHPAHVSAAKWLAAQAPGMLRHAIPVQLGVLRLLSNAQIMGAGVLSPKRALQTWDDLVAYTGSQELHAPQPAHAQALRALVAARRATPNLWTDAWLAALAIATGCDMVSFDRGLRSFNGLNLELLQHTDH